MSITILRPQEIEGMRAAGRVAAATLAYVGSRLEPGVTTGQIDRWVREDTLARGAAPSQLGYHGFPAAVCVSPNEVVCHGIPSDDVILQDGDIVNVDVTSHYKGFHGDCSRTFLIGDVAEDVRALVETCVEARDAGIAAIRDGCRIGDIGVEIETLAHARGYTVVREYGGHGIGRKMHQLPHVMHVGPANRGPRLRAGMAITVEPMLNMGTAAIRMLPDGWTIVTADGRPSAQCEHTVLVTKNGYELLTVPPDELA